MEKSIYFLTMQEFQEPEFAPVSYTHLDVYKRQGVLTIGFGEGHDPAALIAISDANGKGTYFSAADETMLDQAFAAVAGKFGNEFVISYKRPEQLIDVNSEQPVVGVMIDDSGSMDSFRDSTMTMFHDFFAALPEGSLTQFSKFGTNVDMMHITTDQKAVLLQSMGERGKTGGGTEIIRLSLIHIFSKRIHRT